MDWHSVFSMAVSFATGVFALSIVLKRACRSCEERAATWVGYLTCWFVGIYMPVVTIWVNAPFYAWAVQQTTKPAPPELGRQMVLVLEHFAAAYYVSVSAVLLLAYAISRPSRFKQRAPEAMQVSDVVFGGVALLCGLGSATVQSFAPPPLL